MYLECKTKKRKQQVSKVLIARGYRGLEGRDFSCEGSQEKDPRLSYPESIEL